MQNLLKYLTLESLHPSLDRRLFKVFGAQAMKNLETSRGYIIQGRNYSVNWGGGGGEYSYIRVLLDEFLFDFKRTSSGRTRVCEYSAPLPPN